MKSEVSMPLLLGLCLSSVACAGSTKNGEGAATAGLEGLEAENKSTENVPPPPEDAVENAVRAFSGYRALDGKLFSDEEFITFLASADAVCVGERHDQVLDHYAGLRLLKGLDARREFRGFELGLAMEMVRSAHQSTLTAYEQLKMNDAEFEEATEWKTEWGFPIQYYRPQLRFAADHGVHLLGLGVDKELTRAIAKRGLESLDQDQFRALPEIDTEDREHRELFDALMQGHPMKHGSADNFYAAQLVWDEQMAERSSHWLGERAPSRKLLIFAGGAHCHQRAIPSRIARRTGATVVSVLPVEGGTPRSIPDAPTTADERLAAGYDYQMVFSR